MKRTIFPFMLIISLLLLFKAIENIRVQNLSPVNPPDYRMRDGKPIPYSRHNKKSPDGPSEVIGDPKLYRGRVYVVIGQSPIHGRGQGILACIDVATGLVGGPWLGVSPGISSLADL
jgi:hypothetical protein